jgi:transposase InsO family protein
LSVKLRSTCAAGHAHVGAEITSPIIDADIRNELVGPRCTSAIDIFGHKSRCLVDTGSQVSTVSLAFFEQKLQQHTDIKDLDDLINIEVAGGHQLPYKGYIEATVRLPKSVLGSRAALPVLLLVVDETSFNKDIPILLGTNVLKHCLDLCKQHLVQKFGVADLQKYRAPKAWKVAFQCLSMQFGGTVNHENSLPVICTKSNTVTAESCEFVSCTIDNVDSLSFQGHALLVSSDGVTLPGGLIATPMVVDQEDRNSQVMLQIVNPSRIDVTIPVNTVVAKAEEVIAVQAVQQETTASPDSPSVADLFNLSHLPDERQHLVTEMLERNIQAVSTHEFDLGQVKGHKHTIELVEGAKPFRQPYRRIPPVMWEEVRQHLQQMLDAGVIESSTSPFASPIVLVRKKDQSLRFCIDYRKLNSLTIRNAQTMPRPQDIFDRLSGAKWFSSLDLKSGYWQMEVEPKDREKTAFTAGPLGFFQFIRMPFGLCNAGASFQRMIEQCMGSDNLSNCLLYLDDIIVFGKSFEDHLQKLESVLKKLRDCGLKVNPKKCDLFRDKIKYLGHWVTSEGIATDHEKVEAVQNWPIPQSREELKRFLGFSSFYRRFIPQFAQKSEPLQSLLRGQKQKNDPKKGKKNKSKSTLPPFKWQEEQQQSFDALIKALTSAPVLAYADFSKPFELHTDAATSSGLGAVLYQKDDQGHLRVIAYASRSLSDSERRYPAHRLEFLALKWAVTDKFADYLRGSKFIVKTDNNPLTYVMKSAKLDACGQRWAAALCDYDFDIFYKPASSLKDADALSRLSGETWKKMISSTIHAVCQGHSVSDLAFVYGYSLPDGCFGTSVMTHWDVDSWLEAQNKDLVILEVLEALVDRSRKLTSPDAKNLLRQRNKLFVDDDGLLQRRVNLHESEVTQLVVPVSLQQDVLKQLHDRMGHLGVERTLELLRERFYFPRMAQITSDYIKKCDSCLRRKSKPQVAPMGKLESVSPMDLLCIDYLSLETSKGGYSNILVMTDHFTRYAQAVPTRDQTAKTTAKVLLDRFVNHYGLPRQLHSDQGAQFESQVIKQLCHMLGIAKSHTTPYHAQGNAQTERFNSTLLSMLSCLPDEEKSRWKDQVAYVVHAYNCTRHESTGFSPFQLMFGRKPRLPVDIVRDVNLLQDGDADYLKYVQDVRQSLKKAYEKAMVKSEEQHLRGKEAYDKRAHAPELELGDRVLVRKVRFKEGPHKLDHLWEREVFLVVGVPDKDLLVFDVQEENNLAYEDCTETFSCL